MQMVGMADLHTSEHGQPREGGSAVFVVDASGVVRVAEGDGLAVLGIQPGSATGHFASSILGSRPRMLAALHRVLAGEPDRLDLAIDHQTFEVRFEPRTGGGALVLAQNVTASRRLRLEERAAERFLARALRATTGAVWTTDRELRLTFLQGRALDTTGVPRAEGMTVQELVSARDPNDPLILRHLEALGGTGQSFRYPYRGRCFEMAIDPVRVAGGAIRGCVGVALDVTARADAESCHGLPPEAREAAVAKETTRRLERSLSVARAAIDAAADGLLVVDPQGHIVAYNQRFLALWGIPRELAEERDDTTLVRLVHEQLEDPQAFLRGVRDLYTSHDVESFDVLRFKDGRVFERYSIPQKVGDHVVGRVWSFRDVTERERLLHRAEFFADATRLLGSLDVEKALDSVAHLVVKSLAEVCAVDLAADLGVRRLLVVSRPGAQVKTPSPEPQLAALSGHPTLFMMGDASCLSVPLSTSGPTIGALTLVAPPGRRYTSADLDLAMELGRRAALSLENARLYRASQEALRAREEFVSVAAHEIRGPVASMHLAVQGLRQGVLDGGFLPRALDVIEREDRRLTRFVDELLDITKVRAGRLAFTFESVDLAELVRTVASRFTAELSTSGSSLSLASRGPTVGQWDRFRLEQVVTNLLSNAIKFGQGRPIDVSVVGHDDLTTLTVRDRGIGISTAMLEPIFQPFERAVSSRHYGGLGLGLYIVQAIVQGLGGKVKAESPTSGGACFQVELPPKRSAGS